MILLKILLDYHLYVILTPILLKIKKKKNNKWLLRELNNESISFIKFEN